MTFVKSLGQVKYPSPPKKIKATEKVKNLFWSMQQELVRRQEVLASSSENRAWFNSGMFQKNCFACKTGMFERMEISLRRFVLKREQPKGNRLGDNKRPDAGAREKSRLNGSTNDLASMNWIPSTPVHLDSQNDCNTKALPLFSRLRFGRDAPFQ